MKFLILLQEVYILMQLMAARLGRHPSQLHNPDLKWETTLGTNVGVEASILNSRLDFE